MIFLFISCKSRIEIFGYLSLFIFIPAVAMDGVMIASKAVSAKHVLTGSGSAVTAVALDTTGNQALTGYDDASVRLWDLLKTPPTFQVLAAHAKKISFILFSPNSLYAFTQDSDDILYLWDLSKAPPTTIRKSLTRMGAMAFSADSKNVTFANKQWVHVCDMSGSQGSLVIFEHRQASNTAIAFSPDGKYIATGGAAFIKLWDWKNKPLPQYEFKPTYMTLITTCGQLRFLKTGQIFATDQAGAYLFHFTEKARRILQKASDVTETGDKIVAIQPNKKDASLSTLR